MKTVLFVCVGNSARSQMAEGIFNTHAPTGWRAISAGTKPASSVSRKAVEIMAEKDIDISKSVPKLLTTDSIKSANTVISRGCGIDLCPFNLYEDVLDWGIDDPIDSQVEEVRKIRDDIESKVKKLIKELSSR